VVFTGLVQDQVRLEPGSEFNTISVVAPEQSEDDAGVVETAGIVFILA